jgi:hypothetical protein
MKLHRHHPQHDLLIRDVTLRDGLQNLPEILTTGAKLEILDALVEAGVKDFQLTSFVNPARVPQLKDAEAIYTAGVERGLVPNVLVANIRGFERAVDAGVASVDAVLSVSNTYNKKNANRTTLESANEIIVMLSRAAHADCTVGISMAKPGRPVVAIVGDGSAMYGIQGLWTAAHFKLPITYVIANNKGYRIIKERLVSMQGSDRFIGMDMNDPAIDYCQLAQSMGMPSIKVSDPADLDAALKAGIQSGKPKLIEVAVSNGFGN